MVSILLHTKRIPDFISSPAHFCQLLLYFVGYFDVFPKDRQLWIEAHSWHSLQWGLIVFWGSPIYA